MANMRKAIPGPRRDPAGSIRSAEACSMRIAAFIRSGRVALTLLGLAMGAGAFAPAAAVAQKAPPIWTVPEIGALPDDASGRLIRRGRDLVSATYAHVGPEV